MLVQEDVLIPVIFNFTFAITTEKAPFVMLCHEIRSEGCHRRRAARER
jgi:hypothetical protein